MFLRTMQIVMRIHRFYMPFKEVSKGQLLLLREAALVQQLTRVLRLKTNDSIILFNGRGTELTVRLTTPEKKAVAVRVEAVNQINTESLKQVTLYCSLLKRSNFELVVQKATEIGVTVIVPLITSRTVKQGIKLERLLSIMTEATEQSGRSILPRLEPPRLFSDAMKALDTTHTNFLLDSSGEPLHSQLHGTVPVSLFIGPEGGWNGEEVVLARQAGVTIVSLGSFTLRAETAAIVASYLAVSR
jgi:16S rRNA (uracil1498-N3)-methyltransferase